MQQVNLTPQQQFLKTSIDALVELVKSNTKDNGELNLVAYEDFVLECLRLTSGLKVKDIEEIVSPSRSILDSTILDSTMVLVRDLNNSRNIVTKLLEHACGLVNSAYDDLVYREFQELHFKHISDVVFENTHRGLLKYIGWRQVYSNGAIVVFIDKRFES